MAKRIHFDQQIADTIIKEYAAGETIETIIAPAGMPNRITVWRWRESHPEFGQAYEHAMSAHAAALVDKARDLVMNANPKEAKLADVQQRFLTWCASKIHRAQWGDKIEIEQTVKLDISKPLELAMSRMAAVKPLIDVVAKQIE